MKWGLSSYKAEQKGLHASWRRCPACSHLRVRLFGRVFCLDGYGPQEA